MLEFEENTTDDKIQFAIKYLTYAFVIAAVLLVAFVGMKSEYDCRSKKGYFVKTMYGYKCILPNERP